MWNRQLEILAWVHRQGWVHGAVTPNHFIIRPEDHLAKLVGWTAAVKSGSIVKYRSRGHEIYYPAEVAKKGPATAATDIYMAATCLLNMVAPDELHPKVRALIDACRLSRVARFQDAFEVYSEFKSILLSLFGKPTFQPFTMPETSL
jgi:hypothetical protein